MRHIPVLALAIFATSCSSDRSPASTPPKTFIDDTAQCTSWSDDISSAQQKVINEVMAAHMHRLSHVLWHATRNAWSDLNKKEQAAIQRISPEWGKDAPLCPVPAESADKKTSPAGEEFLYMHHQMVDTLRAALADAGQPCIKGWDELPKKDDKVWPIPAEDPKTEPDESKSDDTGEMMDAWMHTLDSKAFLKGKSLSYIGVLVEFSIHNNMHMRWASVPAAHDDFSPLDTAKSTRSLVQPSKYDDASYNWLGNPYSAHVNPVFWKLHGWVDSIIPKWLDANGYNKIAQDCTGEKKCYEWKSTWTGAVHPTSKAMPHKGPSEPPAADDEADKALMKIAPKAGFLNAKFHQFHSEQKKKSPPTASKGIPHHQRDTTYDDPAKYIEKFGPCSK